MATHDIRKNRFEKAIEKFQSLMDQFPLSPHYNESEFLLGLSLQAVRNFEKAWLPLRGSLSREAQPLRRASLQAALGEVYENKKDPFAALISYAEALSNGPELAIGPQVRSRLTRLAHSGVEIHQLLIAADRFRQKPAGPLLRLALARRSVGENRFEASRAAVRRFLSDYPDHPAAQEAEDLLHNLSERLDVNRGRVGVILPLSGPAAPAGERVYQGIQLALRHALERSPHLRIQLAIRDSKSTARNIGKTLETVEDLIAKEKVVTLIGPLFSLSTEAAATVADRGKTPILTPFAVRTDMKNSTPWLFRNSLTNRLQSLGIAAYAVQELGIRNFAVLFPDDNDGRQLASAFADIVRNLGGRVVKSIPFPPDANDFGPQMRALGGLDDSQVARKKRELGLKRTDQYDLALPFEAIFIPAYFDKAVLIAPQIPFYNMKGIRLLGAHGWNSQDLIKYGERYVEGAIFVDGFFSESEEPHIIRFVNDFKRLFGAKPDIFAALGYDAAKMVFGGVAAGMNTRTAMRDYLAAVHGFDGIMGLSDMDPNGDTQRQLFVLTVRKKRILHLQMITPHRASWTLGAANGPPPHDAAAPAQGNGLAPKSSAP